VAVGPSAIPSRDDGFVPQRTHDLTLTDTTVTKCYRSWGRSEPEREWAALSVLAEKAPGLAPRPLDRIEIEHRPAIVMSRLPGTQLGDAPLTAAQAAGVGAAVRRLHEVATDVLPDVLGERVNGPSTFHDSVRRWMEGECELDACADRVVVETAVAAARSWLAGPSTTSTQQQQVLGLADGNLANFMWDGTTCRLVDFEDSGRSDPAYELADHVEHISFRLDGRGDAGGLVATVGLGADDWDRWNEYRRLFACFWLVMLLPGNPGFSRNPPGSVEAQAVYLLDLLSG
jgi:Ser/Thr protein kinase RdoA (MazF antagonist)